MSRGEKKGLQVNLSRCIEFVNRINECQVLEEITLGSKFTWKRPRSEGIYCIFKKFDQALCNVESRLNFLEGFARALPCIDSNQYPIIVMTQREPSNKSSNYI